MLLDVRPGRPDHVYLSDFGLSKGALSAAGMTGSGQVLGTPDYMAPEQIDGRPVDGAADQYALACTAFELLTGEPPFRRDHGMAVLSAHLTQAPPALTARRPGLPAEADAVLAQGLAKEAAGRYKSCQEFADALRTALGIAPYYSGPASAPVASQPARERTWASRDGAAPGSPTATVLPVPSGPGPATSAPAGAGPATARPATISTTARPRRRLAYAGVAAAVAVITAVALLVAYGHHPRTPRDAGPSISPPAARSPARPAGSSPSAAASSAPIQPAAPPGQAAAAGTSAAWSRQGTIAPGSQLTSVSCPSPSFCAAVSSSGGIYVSNGNGWASAASTGDLLGAVTCPTSSFCATDGWNTDGDVFTYDGGGWSQPQVVDPGHKLHSISCPTADFCVAGAATNVFIDSGGTWSAPVSVDANDTNGTGITSVSCPTTTFCVAVDALGNALADRAGSWTMPDDIDGAMQINGVSCVSASFCVAVDNAGRELTYAGGSWSAPRSIAGTSPLTAVSCTSPSFCVAVSDGGTEVTFRGGTWSAPATIDAGAELTAVSCASASFCVAADANGSDFAMR
jgi:hypothetical protein